MMKLFLAIVASAILFVSCQTSQGCGCLHTDTQTQVENTADAEQA